MPMLLLEPLVPRVVSVDLVMLLEIASCHLALRVLLVVLFSSFLKGEMYKALKEAKKLVAYEQELLENASRGTSLRQHRETDRQPA